ncbi:hypothetical protein V6582_01465 (plasmid) [Agrobacterium vitis]|uniref:hypothetical protein n=1 Tax=Agrobacterium vitis TaxID=373 RepID=UPI0012E7EA59|nr:hypothetical protein [Agrobacterium vitis]MVA25093.1 hypothetical protein [Agrobacterium vitis]
MASDPAKGRLALTSYPAGENFIIHKRLKQYIIDTGKLDLRDTRHLAPSVIIDGLVESLISVEIMRQA